MSLWNKGPLCSEDMMAISRASLSEIVHEIVDVSPALGLSKSADANGYATHVQAALSRSHSGQAKAGDLRGFSSSIRRE